MTRNMNIKIHVNDEKTGVLIVERIAEIALEGDLAREVAHAVDEASKKSMEPYGWRLHVDKG